MSALQLVTGPAEEPLTAAEAKVHLRVTSSDEDSLITALIAVARQHVESVTRRALVTQIWDYFLDGFPHERDGRVAAIEVPRPRLASVGSITYVDEAGDGQTLATADYQVDIKSEPGRIVPAYGLTWPGTREQLNAVTVRFTAGFGAAATVPAPIKAAMLLIIGQLFENREAVITGTIVTDLPRGVDALLFPYRVLRF